MALSDDYLRYLDHFGETTTVSDLAGDPARAGVALRHDVDHDLDAALDMGFWEYRLGHRASYYLLHTAPYWTEKRLVDACLQLQDYGHEVGLHLNVLTEWTQGLIHDPNQRLRELLGTLREHGVSIRGTSAHGDRVCYEQGFINYWLYQELRPGDPEQAEHGLSAEGVPDPGGRFAIPYPPDHRLARAGGGVFPLWSISMAHLGIEHEAVRVPTDRYLTDSGGRWERSPDPLELDLSTGRTQVLVHPEYWRAPQRAVFFLSTARSGSKWFATVLDEGTSATVKHEFSLNHRYRNDEVVPEKRTGLGARTFLQDTPLVRRCLAEVRTWVETLKSDYFEANVYLPEVLDELREVYPDATLVHLHRDPYAVVRSILNREWYDTPDDERHPAMEVEGWDDFDQLERCAWYVRATGERLRKATDHRLNLEEITTRPVVLQSKLAPLGVAFHPRLASSFYDLVNAGTSTHVPPLAEWKSTDRRRMSGILAGERRTLGYTRVPQAILRVRERVLTRGQRRSSRMVANAEQITLVNATGAELLESVGFQGCQLRVEGSALVVTPDGDRHANVRLGGGEWRRISPKQGWASPIGTVVHGAVDAEISGGNGARLICLMYDADGELMTRRDVAVLGHGWTEFAFRPRPDTVGWDLAIYIPQDAMLSYLCVHRLRLVASYGDSARAG